MATRKIIRIDEDLCNGCGDCVVGCAEGALQIVDGKARLVREDFCDGFGDCVGTCPTGALTIDTRPCDDYDDDAARRHVAALRGTNGLTAFDDAALRHGSTVRKSLELAPVQDVILDQRTTPAPGFSPSPGGGCPGSKARVLPRPDGGLLPPIPHPPAGIGKDPSFSVLRPELAQWPIQLHLISPHSSFLKDRELVILATCAPVAMPDVNWRFVRGRSVALACPKLDRVEGYVEKLAAILAEPSIPRALVVRMEVPCCGGLTDLVVEGGRRSGRGDLEIVEMTVDLQGNLRAARQLCRGNCGLQPEEL